MLTVTRWVFRRDPDDGFLYARRRPRADDNLVAVAETLAVELDNLDRLAEWLDDWIGGSATDPFYKAGTEAVHLYLEDSVVIRVVDVYGQFQATRIGRTGFRAMIDGLQRALERERAEKDSGEAA